MLKCAKYTVLFKPICVITVIFNVIIVKLLL